MYKRKDIKRLEEKYKDLPTQILIDNDIKEVEKQIKSVKTELLPLFDELIILYEDEAFLKLKRRTLFTSSVPIEFEGEHKRTAIVNIKAYFRELFKVRGLNKSYKQTKRLF